MAIRSRIARALHLYGKAQDRIGGFGFDATERVIQGGKAVGRAGRKAEVALARGLHGASRVLGSRAGLVGLGAATLAAGGVAAYRARQRRLAARSQNAGTGASRAG
jgi:hypothetical protein